MRGSRPVRCLAPLSLFLLLAIDDSSPAFAYLPSQIPRYGSVSASLLRRKGNFPGVGIGGNASIGSRRRSRHSDDRILHATPVKYSPTSFAAAQDDQADDGDSSYEEGLLVDAYNAWREEYKKGSFDPARYQNFKLNYIRLTAANAAELRNARETGKLDPIPLTLNEYGDYSSEEYKVVRSGGNMASRESFSGEERSATSPQSAFHGNAGYTSSTNAPPYGAFTSQGELEQERIRQIYRSWCSTNGRPCDESRLDIFAFNLKVVENYYQETGKKAELNRYADLSPEEFEVAIQNRDQGYRNGVAAEMDTRGSPESDPTTSPLTSTGNVAKASGGSYLETLSNMAKSFATGSGWQQADTEKSPEEDKATVERERVRTAYRDWCQTNEKDYQESRLDIFATNFLSVEKYCKETGSVVALNKFADLDPEEYKMAIQAETAGAYSSPSSRGNSYLDNLQNQPSTPSSLGISYLDNLSTGSSSVTTPSEAVEDRIREIYRDWCQYYEKVPDEGRLQNFAMNLVAIEKHHRETGEELTLNEFADEAGVEYQRQQTAMEMQRQAVAEQKEAADRQAEQARLEGERQRLEDSTRRTEDARVEEERRRADETRLQEERSRAEEARLQEQRRRTEEEQRRAEEVRLQEERQAAEEARPREEARLVEEIRFREEKKQAEEVRWQDEKRQVEAALRIAEESRFEAESKRADAARLEDESRKAEAARKSAGELEAQLEEEREKAVKTRIEQEKRETEIQLYEARRREEAASLEAELNEGRLEEQIMQLESALREDQARRQEETSLQAKAGAIFPETSREVDKSNTNEEVTKDAVESSPMVLPRSTYMDAVARTWIDRSAYLESLQEGNYGVLPNSSGLTPPKPVEKRRSQPLVESIWNFMNAPPANRGGKSASEQYAESLIQQADEMISDASKSAHIEEEELRYLKEAVDALRRRNEDENAADEARTEAKEWQKIQQGLEKEAKKAKERREYEERLAEEARRRAQYFEKEERKAEEDRRKARTFESSFVEQRNEVGGKPFSFFPGSFLIGEKGDTSQSVPPPFEMKEPAFSFFGQRDVAQRKPKSSFTKPVVVARKESWFNVIFDFFGTNRIQEEPGQGTITLEPARRTSVFDLFVSPEMIAPREPGRGSITIEETKKPSIFSFFANFGKETKMDPNRRQKVLDYENRRRSRQEKLSWLEAGRSRILEQSDKNLSRKEARRLQRELEELAMGDVTSSTRKSEVPQLAKWTKTPDGRITGYVTESSSKYRLGTKITTSRIKGQKIKAGVTVTTVSGSQYRLGLPIADTISDKSGDARDAAPRSRNNRPTPLGFLFGGMLGADDVPDLVEWTQNEDGTLTGFVNNKEGFEDGTQITTSPVNQGAKMGMIVQTRGGSKYRLLKQK